MIEVAVQTDHLLQECNYRNNFKKCPRCTEAINTTIPQENELHFKTKQCVPADKKGNRCPLCHTNIGASEEVWKEHLMSSDGCSKNTRKPSSNNAQNGHHNTNNTNNHNTVPESSKKTSNRK